MSRPPIPSIPQRFFRWYCRKDLYEEVHGDLEEFYYEDVERIGIRRARWKYLYNVIRCCQPYTWNSYKIPYNHNLYMLRNNFIIAFRSIRKDTVFSAINILGLTLGIAFSGMLYLYVEGELTYDSFWKESEQIHRALTIDMRVPDQPRIYGVVPPPTGQAMLNDFPEVTAYTSLHKPYGQIVFQIDEENYQERSWFITDNTFFQVFDYQFLAGDPKTCLSNPRSVVLTASAALQYFGSTDVLGNTLELGDEQKAIVTGVLNTSPGNTHQEFKILISRNTDSESWLKYEKNWETFAAYTYIRTTQDIEVLKLKMDDFESRHIPSRSEFFDLDFQPIEDIYLGSEDIQYGLESKHGIISYIYIFGGMGVLILIIACINYINLTTSKASFKAKEIGIRKVVGARRSHLASQLITESLVMAFIGFILAIVIMDLVFPFFNSITGTSFDITWTNIGSYLLPTFLMALTIGLLSGIYPAFFLSGFGVLNSIKGQNLPMSGSGIVRKTLVVFQFSLTMVLIVSTMVIGQQLQYIEDKDIGFKSENLVVIDINNRNVRSKFQAMKNEFSSIPGIESVGVSSRVPGEWKNITQIYVKPSTSTDNDSLRMFFMGYDEGMLQTYGMKMKTGNFFSSNTIDSTEIILNEAALQTLGLEEPIGQSLIYNMRGDRIRFTIAGVVENFHFQSLHNRIEPLIIGTWNNPAGVIDYFTLKISGDRQEVLQAANLVHEKFDQFTPMEYNFLDERLADFYDQEEKVGKIFILGAVLSILVACMGLFGLASFIALKREKELGIRKVLGARASTLFLLLSNSFLKQIAIAFIIGSPVAYLLMKDWLASFEYRISLGPGVFFLAGLLAIVIALMTVTYRSMKVVQSNPIDSLRNE